LQREILDAYDHLAIAFPFVYRHELRAYVVQSHHDSPSFGAAFSRALHALCMREELVALSPDGAPTYPWRGGHIGRVFKPDQLYRLNLTLRNAED
jgi:hypothetical protein